MTGTGAVTRPARRSILSTIALLFVTQAAR